MILAAARVHDIGKLGLPDDLIHQKGSLTPEEKALMASHAERGADLLLRYPDFARGVDMVRHHHEHWDGSGYPYRLKGKDIPLGARIIAVANEFDAMTNDRPHRHALPVDRAASILRDGRGIQWDPAIVDAFLQSIADRLDQAVAPALRVLPSPEVRAETTASA
jgi:HD-GYP domain-containing protein (c-di-GMP phosphodiesterase class II)